MEDDIKSAFIKKLQEVDDPSVLFEVGIPVLKRQLRIANENLADQRTDVENMLTNPVYLTAVDQAEHAKLVASLASWKLQETIKRLQVLVAGVDEDDGTGVFEE